MTRQEFHYPTETVIGDYIRAGAGISLTGLPLLLVEMLPVVQGILALAAIIFTVFGIRTLLRHRTRFVLDGPILYLQGPRPRQIDLDKLKKFDLRFYSTRRDRRVGWMQLTLADDRHRVMIESTVMDFDRLLDTAISAALMHDLELSDGTVSNLLALGYEVQYAVEKQAAEKPAG